MAFLKRLRMCPVCILLFVGLLGCAASVEEPVSEPAAATEADAVSPQQEEQTELWIPYDYAWEETAEEVAATVARLGLSDGVLHEDGAITYTFSDASQHEALIMEAEAHVSEQINANIEKNNLTVFTEILLVPPYTVIDVMVDPAQYKGSEDGLFPLFFYVGGHYQATVGVPIDEIDVVVNYINKDTGDLIASGSLREQRARDLARAASAIDIEDIVAVDNGQLRITVKELYPEEEDGYGIGVELENFTEDTWSITPTHMAVNALAVDSSFSCNNQLAVRQLIVKVGKIQNHINPRAKGTTH